MCRRGLEAKERARRAGLDTNREIQCRISSDQLHAADDDFLTRLF